MKSIEYWLLAITTICWTVLFAHIGKQFVDPSAAGEIVGIFCGISIGLHTSLAAIQTLKQLRGNKQ